ncbi:MAG: hypothetical protein LWW94_10365 [Candidatus Desulfofervidaceae bacterium]|nr:hypothetical protein [Candidatus Desulfofervidaceae bacterium]
MRINPYYLSLIKQKGDPIWLQAIPDKRELEDKERLESPLAEEAQSPVPNLTHRYLNGMKKAGGCTIMKENFFLSRPKMNVYGVYKGL